MEEEMTYTSNIIEHVPRFADFGSDKDTIHSYGEFYSTLLAPYIDRENFTLLEIGVQNGSSMRAFRDYLPKAGLVGVDIKEPISVDGYEFYHADINEFTTMERFDVIIDDGSHLIAEQLKALENLYDNLKDGGVYVIEDIQSPAYLPMFEQRYANVTVMDYRQIKGRYDDMLVVIKK